MGPLPGILGALMALEALRILGGLPAALLGRRLTFQGRVFSFREVLRRSPPTVPSVSTFTGSRPRAPEEGISHLIIAAFL